MVPTTLSYSSRVSLSPAVLLKLLVLEEEREMFDLPFSFSLMNGLRRGAKQNKGHVVVTQKALSLRKPCPSGSDSRDRPSCAPPEQSSCRRDEPSGVLL